MNLRMSLRMTQGRRSNGDSSAIEAILDSTSYTNEQKSYYFLVKEMDITSPRRAACSRTSTANRIRPPRTIRRRKLRLCQWTAPLHFVKNYCADNGSLHTLRGQLS
jgi:hypothetical protein